jgi:hypothetical protein
MFVKEKRKDSTFAYALGGAAIAGTFVPVPVVINRRINDAWDERLKNRQEEADRPQKAVGGRFSLRNVLRFSRAY